MNSREKGARAEREVCELLRAWWSGLEPDVEFVRSPGSGGWARQGTRSRAEFKAGGDVVTTSKTFPFCTEVKFRESWSENHLAKGYRTPVEGWWGQATAAAIESKSIPLLVFRKVRKPWNMAISHAHLIMCSRNPAVFLDWPQFTRTLGDCPVVIAPFAALLHTDPQNWVMAR